MMDTKKTNLHIYEGLVFVLSNWAVYREVSREDVESGNPVFALRILGLEYAPIESLLKPIRIDDQPFEVQDGIEYVRHGRADGIEVLCVTPTQTFTGANRKKGSLPETVYLTPVTREVPVENPSRGFISVRVARD